MLQEIEKCTRCNLCYSHCPKTQNSNQQTVPVSPRTLILLLKHQYADKACAELERCRELCGDDPKCMSNCPTSVNVYKNTLNEIS